MATHSSILTWRIPWTEEPGRLHSMESQRVEHDSAIITSHHTTGGFPGGASGKESACQSRRHKRRGLDPWAWKVPWRREWLPTPAFLSLENSMDRGAWWAIVPGVAKSQTRLSTSHAHTYHRRLALKKWRVSWKPQLEGRRNQCWRSHASWRSSPRSRNLSMKPGRRAPLLPSSDSTYVPPDS